MGFFEDLGEFFEALGDFLKAGVYFGIAIILFIIITHLA